jgi:sensor histidine kinase YesM
VFNKNIPRDNMKRYFIHNPLFRIVAPVVYGVLIYLLILLINNDVTQVNELFTTADVKVCIGLSFLSFEFMRVAIVLLGRMLGQKNQTLIIWTQFVATTVLSVALVLASLSLYFVYFIGFSISATQLLVFGAIFVVTALLYNLLYFSNYYLQKENTVRLNAEKQQRDVLEMEMLEFKNDINPDLLYESLESVISLMYRNADEAEEYIDHLASAYRYVLSNRHLELVPLSKELEAGKVLLRLLNEKYQGQLKFESSFREDELQAMLIPGSLPVMLEGIIRNTIIARSEPFIIRCYIEDDYITIQSKLNDRLILHPASEMAFGRLQRSYSLYSDLPLIKVKAYQENYIKLPVIQVANEI